MNKNLALLLILTFFVLIEFADGCARREFGVPVCANYTRADVVFLGKAVKTEDVSGKDDFGTGVRKVRFQVLQNFKGADNPTIAVIIPDCSPQIKKGHSRIVFAKINLTQNYFYEFHAELYDEKKNRAESEFLKQISDGKTDGAIAGRLTSTIDFGKYPFEAAEIVIEGTGTRQTLKTDAIGAFGSGSLPGGKYQIELKLPFRASLLWTETLLKTSFTEGVPSVFKYEVDLREGDCDFGFFEVSRF